MIELIDIKIYPIKSLAGISLRNAFAQAKGLALDRRWMLIDSHGRFLSQRQDPNMALLHLEGYDSEYQQLKISHRQGSVPPLRFSLEPVPNNPKIRVRIWEDELEACLVSPAYDKWFTKALGRECRLVYMPDSAARRVDPNYAEAGDSVSFADGFPYLIVNQASLEALNRHLAKPITMDRFRANLIVRGAEAWVEDQWDAFTIGQAAFRSLKACARCQLITVDPQSGEKSAEPLKTLSQLRKRGSKVFFGVNACWHTESDEKLKIGDELIPSIQGT